MGSRLGSVGAALFLVAFAAIVWFVYQEAQKEDHAQIRHPAPLALEAAPKKPSKPEPPPPPPPPPLPAWREALDLREAVVVQATLPETPKDGTDPNNPGAAAQAARKRPKGRAGKQAGPLPEVMVQTLPDNTRALLTLDPKLQAQTLALFAEKELPYAGAVLLDLRDNSVLVMAGHSSANPNVDPLDVITTAWSPAASTFKTITAAELVEQRHARPNTKVCFHGGVSGITDALLKDNPALDTRCATLTDAIAHSHNVLIAKLALRHLGRKDVIRAARRFMYEQPIPFEVPIERSPIGIPVERNARAKVAAGFWHTDLSPMHGAVIASIFARGGLFQPPHFVAERLTDKGEAIWPELTKPERRISAKTAKAVGEMMVHTTTRGTAKRSFRGRRGSLTPGVVVAGKTGALTGKLPPNYNYNWLIGFAPAQAPEVAFAVVLANPPKWRIKAHFAARRLIQNYWARRKQIQKRPPLALTPNGVVVQKRAEDATLRPLKSLPPGELRVASDANAVPPEPGLAR